MKKVILILIILLLIVGCQVKKQTGEIVMMPEGYTLEQTNQFIKSILTQDFKESIHSNFPELSMIKKCGFRYVPVKTKSLSGESSKYGIIIKIYGVDDSDLKESFMKHVLHHLKNERQEI